MEPEGDLETALRRRARGVAVRAALVRRARQAVATAEAAVARARVVNDGLRLARDSQELMRRCAWCSRVALGGAWIDAEEAERLVGRRRTPEVSHTICPDCAERLVREHKSR